MIQFKSPRIEQEFATLAMVNLRLFNILQAAGDFCFHELNKHMVITCLFRTPEENAALYTQIPEPAWRPHTKWQAADLRSSIYTPQEIQRLLDFFNQYRVWGGQRKCAIYHMIAGNTFHFHTQSPMSEDT